MSVQVKQTFVLFMSHQQTQEHKYVTLFYLCITITFVHKISTLFKYHHAVHSNTTLF